MARNFQEKQLQKDFEFAAADETRWVRRYLMRFRCEPVKRRFEAADRAGETKKLLVVVWLVLFVFECNVPADMLLELLLEDENLSLLLIWLLLIRFLLFLMLVESDDDADEDSISFMNCPFDVWGNNCDCCCWMLNWRHGCSCFLGFCWVELFRWWLRFSSVLGELLLS